jgi:hypothetical protein
LKTQQSFKRNCQGAALGLFTLKPSGLPYHENYACD